MRFVVGALLLGIVAQTIAYASVVEVRCKPVVLPDCGNPLKTYFEKGYVPNRCRTS